MKTENAETTPLHAGPTTPAAFAPKMTAKQWLWRSVVALPGVGVIPEIYVQYRLSQAVHSAERATQAVHSAERATQVGLVQQRLGVKNCYHLIGLARDILLIATLVALVASSLFPPLVAIAAGGLFLAVVGRALAYYFNERRRSQSEL